MSSDRRIPSIMLSIGLLLGMTGCSAVNAIGGAEGAGNTAESISSPVTYQFYRNATAKLTYNGQTLLLDPMLGAKGSLPSFAGIEPNPTIDLPVPVSEIVEGIDSVIVGHLHPDHFDTKAAEVIAKDMPIYTPANQAPMNPQDPANTTLSFKTQLEQMGYTNVSEIASNASNSIEFDGITLTQEFGQHGKGILSTLMGGVNGILLQADGAPTIYWTGDTILDEGGQVEAILAKYKPDIIIAHTGGAIISPVSPDPLMMDEAQAAAFFQAAEIQNPDVKIIAVHMNALDHCFTTRETLAEMVSTLPEEVREGIVIPSEGVRLTL